MSFDEVSLQCILYLYRSKVKLQKPRKVLKSILSERLVSEYVPTLDMKFDPKTEYIKFVVDGEFDGVHEPDFLCIISPQAEEAL